VYVRPGAIAGGDGSLAMPFATIEAAVGAVPAADAVLLARGAHTIATTVTLDRSIILRGVGADASATRLEASANTVAIHASGMAVAVTIERLCIRFAPSTVDRTMERAILVDGGARAAIDNVLVEGAYTGIETTNATIFARHMTVRGAGRYAMLIGPETTATIEDFVVADSSLYGVVARNSHVELSRGWIHDNVRDGLAVLGNRGMASVVREVASVRNGVTAMRFENGANVLMEHATAAGSVLPPDTIGADGVYVGPGSTLVVDPADPQTARGTASCFVGNGRTGLLINGLGASFSARGIRVASNQGPGMYNQAHAVVQSLAFADFFDNSAINLCSAANAQIVAITDSRIAYAHLGEVTTTFATFRLADGISISESPGSVSVLIARNQFDFNERFAILLAGTAATLSANTGMGNRFGIGAYGSSLTIDSYDTIGAREPSPISIPNGARGPMEPSR